MRLQHNSDAWDFRKAYKLGDVVFPWDRWILPQVQLTGAGCFGQPTFPPAKVWTKIRMADVFFKFLQHISTMSSTTNLRSALGNTALWITESKSSRAHILWLSSITTILRKDKLSRPAGHDTLSSFSAKMRQKVKLRRPSGHATLSKLWLKSRPKVKLWRPAGHVTLSRLWLKPAPKVTLWRPAGHVTLSRLWLNKAPKVKLWRPAGHLTLSMACLKKAQESNFEALLAIPRCPGSDWSYIQKSSYEGLLAMSHCPG